MGGFEIAAKIEALTAYQRGPEWRHGSGVHARRV
jgi:hypothetical protein